MERAVALEHLLSMDTISSGDSSWNCCRFDFHYQISLCIRRNEKIDYIMTVSLPWNPHVGNSRANELDILYMASSFATCFIFSYPFLH
ncbi:hypothetical protein Gasu2_36400 [Galdieria sulphuraria]|uniref:Uncharacterized protein n=1 Tax=Galdieria sulphuraria TaxID=130081 RepID=M2WTA3_GALSU|nr:uncharacterized protein Gasu_52380 [Galdieria sulphuraria]EME27135.1 hypothetical protein Gasu_52380 [Galdieria sulphuraria]GJD09384.1 hypothetical protein Gasu2_36400 [Galdieria sulphuraria]|eukprot:XP_005703655.1 hypothetical protein Gasu_52380 [Galdieria sulphuraria]